MPSSSYFLFTFFFSNEEVESSVWWRDEASSSSAPAPAQMDGWNSRQRQKRFLSLSLFRYFYLEKLKVEFLSQLICFLKGFFRPFSTDDIQDPTNKANCKWSPLPYSSCQNGREAFGQPKKVLKIQSARSNSEARLDLMISSLYDCPSLGLVCQTWGQCELSNWNQRFTLFKRTQELQLYNLDKRTRTQVTSGRTDGRNTAAAEWMKKQFKSKPN